MLKIRILIMLSLIFLEKSYDYAQCNYNIFVREACGKLKSEEEGLGCDYVMDKCISSRTTCEQYTGINPDDCVYFEPIDFRYKCVYNEEERKCTSILKGCENSIYDKDYCEGLSTGNPKTRCIFGGGCYEHYNNCEDIQTESECFDNIPSDNRYKCTFDYDKKKCVSEKRTCYDYDNIMFKRYGLTLKCWEYPSETEGKSCIITFKNSRCEEGYRQCEECPDGERSQCESTIPSDGKGNFNYSAKCELENDKCVTKDRKCEESLGKYGPECTSIILSDKTKRCLSYDYSNCIEVPTTCENYTENSKEICELITIYDPNGNRDYSHKCSFEDNTCKTIQRECNEATDSDDCNKIILSDKERCIYKDDKCEKFYKNCEDYDGTDSDTCELIQPFKSMYELDDENECVFENDKCVKKKKEYKYCDYDGGNEEICERLPSSDPSTKVCGLLWSKCVELYKDCSYYKDITSSIDTNCTYIVPYDSETGKKDPYSKCVGEYINGKLQCVKQPKNCEDYYGFDSAICSKYKASSDDKICVLKEKKCTEQYKTCETSNKYDPSICEEIVLSDFTKKCVLSDDGKCETKDRTCSELDEDYFGNICYSYTPKEYKRRCALAKTPFNTKVCVARNN